jgi:hypothetical protein
VAEALDLKPVGGVLLRNRRKQVVFWFKGKGNQTGGRNFALCVYRPELADSPEMRREMEVVFGKVQRLAEISRMQLFDMDDFESELRQTFNELGVGAREYVRSRRTEDVTFKLTDLVSGRKVDVVFGITPVKPKRKRRGERP